ncbi:MAG: Enamine/imine deaminase [Methanomassiliicoccales archaeon PtaU1.Bin124]|nr:MAG: Enamine/imine deaminase [Methanomassiliicoccales archaeon PtaU1.Bin124]
MRKTVHSEQAPKAIGPYSQAIISDGMLYCSGQLGLDPATGKIVPGGIEAETRQALRNLQKVAEAAGGDLKNAVRCGVFVIDLAEFPQLNAVYAEHFRTDAPARTTVQVAKLPLGGRVEIDAIIRL